MVALDRYRAIIKQLLKEYEQSASSENTTMESILDESQDRYQLVAFGWQGKKRIHGCVVHIDIKDNKVWLQHDSTDAQIADQLVSMGISAQDIVLGFHPEHLRPYTGFAVK